MLRQLRWQIALALAGLAAIGLLVVAFSDRGFQDRPTRGGQLVEAVIGRPAQFDPLFSTTEAEADVARLVFCGLVQPTGDGTLRPDLAASWTVGADGRTYRFRLREGATWHDGQPVTSADVVFTAVTARRVATDARMAALASPKVRPWSRVTASAPDELTVDLTLDEPYAPFLEAATLGILPAHLLADVTTAELPNVRFGRLEPIGCGPYRVDLPGGIDDTAVRLVRFDEHWDADGVRPYLDGLTFRFYPGVDAAVEALAEREVQAMGGVPPVALDRLGDDVRLYLSQRPGYALVYLNLGNVLFEDPGVRLALSLAVDRAGIVQDAETLGGQGVVAAGPLPPASWAYDEELPQPVFDPAEARRRLEQLGWIDSDGDGIRDREGKALRFGLASRDDAASLAVAEQLRAGWQAVGVDVELQPMNQPATVSTLGGRAFDAALFSWDLQQHDPDPYPLWHSSQAPDGQNYGGFADEEADRLLAEARRARADDVEARRAAYVAFQRRFAELYPAILLYHPVYAYAVADPTLGGVQLPALVAESADRYLTLGDWYLRTERVFRGR